LVVIPTDGFSRSGGIGGSPCRSRRGRPEHRGGLSLPNILLRRPIGRLLAHNAGEGREGDSSQLNIQVSQFQQDSESRRQL